MQTENQSIKLSIELLQFLSVKWLVWEDFTTNRFDFPSCSFCMLLCVCYTSMMPKFQTLEEKKPHYFSFFYTVLSLCRLTSSFRMSPFSLSTLMRFQKAPFSKPVFKALRFQKAPLSNLSVFNCIIMDRRRLNLCVFI